MPPMGLNSISVLLSALASKYGDRHPFHEGDRLGQRRTFQGVRQVVSTPGSSGPNPPGTSSGSSTFGRVVPSTTRFTTAPRGKQRRRTGATPTKSEDRMLRVLHLNINRDFRLKRIEILTCYRKHSRPAKANPCSLGIRVFSANVPSVRG